MDAATAAIIHVRAWEIEVHVIEHIEKLEL
jgi:hypothetical protein